MRGVSIIMHQYILLLHVLLCGGGGGGGVKIDYGPQILTVSFIVNILLYLQTLCVV